MYSNNKLIKKLSKYECIKIALIIILKLRMNIIQLKYSLANKIGLTHNKYDLLEFINRSKVKGVGIPLIRVGGSRDGGYLVPDILEKVRYCFSPGVSDNSDFEVGLLDYRIKIFQADYSVTASPMGGNADFTRKYIGAKNTDTYMRLDDWIDGKVGKDENKLLLQMDIEGFEYEVINSLSESFLNRFIIIIIEFHNLEKLFRKKNYNEYSKSFKKILKNFTIAHIHPNNSKRIIRIGEIEVPPVMEFTFLRNDQVLCSDRSEKLSFPHKLDRKCSAEFEEIILPRGWY